MDVTCKNHSFSDAHWYCKKCNSSYCFTCVEKKHFEFSKDETFVHICPDCKRMVEWTGIRHLSDPFLKRIKKALIYPFAPYSLIVLAALSVMGLLLTKNVILNEIIFTLMWITLLSYANTITAKTIKGKNEPPKINAIHVNDAAKHIFMIFKQSAVYLIFCTLFVLSTNLDSVVPSILILVVSSLILPYIMIKSMTAKTVKSFFDPIPLIQILKKSSGNYLIISLLVAPVVAVFHLMLVFNATLTIPFLCYAVLVTYRLLGQLILNCHSELNYSLDYENFKNKYSLETLHGFKV